MACLEQKSILDLPDEVIEVIMVFLSYKDLFSLSKDMGRLKDCVTRVLKRREFQIAIIGGHNGRCLNDVEVISIRQGLTEAISYVNISQYNDEFVATPIMKYSIYHIPSRIPSLPKGLLGLGGTKLPNGDLLICGGWTGSSNSDEYLIYQSFSNQWTKVGTMTSARRLHSSVWIHDRLLTIGGYDPSGNRSSYHEQFSLDGDAKERTKMPIALRGQTATTFGHQKMLICGGDDGRPSQGTLIYHVKENRWTEGPAMLTPRDYHCSCAIQSDDGLTKCVIIIGGTTNKGRFSKSTEILNLKDQKWVQGPLLPVGIEDAACVALPPQSDFACIVVGGEISDENVSPNVYGLNKTLTKWSILGKIKTGRRRHIALPLS